MSSKAYVIATDHRNEPGKTLFLADRTKCGEKFWVTNLDEVLVYHHLDYALLRSQKLHYNNPRVISLEEAKELIH